MSLLHVYTCIYMYICVCVHVCMYICILTFTTRHLHTCTKSLCLPHYMCMCSCAYSTSFLLHPILIMTACYPHYDCMLSSLSPYRMTVCGSFERRLPRARLSCCLPSAPRPIPPSLRRSSLARSGASSGGNSGSPPRSPRPLARSQSWTPERSGWTSTRRSQRVILWPTSTRPASPGRICRASRRLLRPQSPVLRLGIRLSIEPGGGRR